MAFFWNKTHLVSLLLLQVLIHSSSLGARTRLRNTLDVKFNLDCHLPQCTTTDPDRTAVNLFQVISSNPETPERTNFIMSNIGGPPMVITASSSRNSNLLIDWETLLNNQTNKTSGFHFDVAPDASIGLLVEKIILFDDDNGNGLLEPHKKKIEVDWSDIVWDLASRTTYHKDDFLKTHLRMKPQHPYLNGNILIKLAIPRDYKADRQKEVPHLKLNNQSMSMVVIVDGIQAPPGYQNTRLAMTFVVVVQSPPQEQVSLETETESLISDEYTPGVFRIKSLQFTTKAAQQPTTPVPEENTESNVFAEIDGERKPLINPAKAPPVGEKLGFLYWKEVAYTDRRKIISRTIDVHDVETKMGIDTLPNISQPFYQYYNYKPDGGSKLNYTLFRFELTFGKSDALYSSSNFTDFSFVFGLGAAPQEQMFSFLVKIIIFVCFCLPILVMLAGLGYLTLRRFRRNGDTELLLAAES